MRFHRVAPEKMEAGGGGQSLSDKAAGTDGNKHKVIVHSATGKMNWGGVPVKRKKEERKKGGKDDFLCWSSIRRQVGGSAATLRQ